jgi:membrane protein DedA with SNARE-associated domain
VNDAWPVAAAIAGGTLIAEDATCLAVGLLVHGGTLDPLLGIAATAVGIAAGDLALWLCGRLGARRALRWQWLATRLPVSRMAAIGEALDTRLGRLLLASRALPGTRLPLYLAAGALGRRPLAFAMWTIVSVALWVPLVVVTIGLFGPPVVGPLEAVLGSNVAALALAAFSLLVAVRVLPRLARPRVRARIWARVSRLWRWEFWPSWIFYAPVVGWVMWLAVRHGGLGTLAAANPGMPDGGFVGESKSDILATLPADATLPGVRIDPGTADNRLAALRHAVDTRGWQLPLVLKPDVGQRGSGVRLIRCWDQAAEYLGTVPAAVIAQVYHPGPFEAGIFYYRRPGETRGRILSITDKHFPSVVGDGHRTIEQLVWDDSRLRMQAARFLARLGDRCRVVPRQGERVALALAGNHAQGTLFRDGAYLLTPALERRVDEIARSVPGFFVGRFDVRYVDIEAFKRGLDLAIVELNGATAESTNIYDPSRSLVAAYRTLFRQWQIVFEIGAANRRLGHPATPLRRLLGLSLTHLMTRDPLPVAD